MGKIIGRLGSLGIAKEATRGTSVAPAYWVPATDIDFDDGIEHVDNDAGMGRIEEKNDSDILQLFGSGSVEGKIYDKSVGVELTALMGQSPTSVQRGVTGVYDHTYTLANNNQHKSMTVGYKDENQDLRFALAMINTWSLEAALDAYVMRTMELMSKKSASASNTVSYVDENEFIPKNMIFKLATNLAGLDGASATKIRSLSLEVNKNAEALYVLGSNEPDDIANRQIALTGSFEAYMDSLTLRNLVYANTNQAIRIDIVNADLDIGGGHNPALRFDIAKIKFGPFDRGFDNNEIMLQTLEFEALFSIADSSMFTARLTNAFAGTNY